MTAAELAILLVRDGEPEPRLGARRQPAHQAGAQHAQREVRHHVDDRLVLLGAAVALPGGAQEVAALRDLVAGDVAPARLPRMADPLQLGEARVEMLGERALGAACPERSRGHGCHVPVRVLNPGVPAMKAGVRSPAPPPLLVIVLE